MDRTSELTFTAEYRLADGTSAVIAQAQDPWPSAAPVWRPPRGCGAC
jgi:hypothetical protein